MRTGTRPVQAERPPRRCGARVRVVVVLALAGIGLPVRGAGFDIAQLPLFVGGNIEPNLMYLHDDSGSMSRGYLPDSVNAARTSARGHSSSFNRQYYNPQQRYLPPLDHEGRSLGDARFEAAWVNGYAAARDLQRTDLTHAFRHSWTWDQGSGEEGEAAGSFAWTGPAAGEPAYYYRYERDAPECDGTPGDEDCYLKVIVGATSGDGSVDLNGDGRLSEADRDERTNFANWYAYYRVRSFAARAGISRAFASLGEGIRVGYGSVNQGLSAIDGKSVYGVSKGVRPFSGEARKAFYDWLFTVPSSGNTPLRRALNGAGSYFENASALGPWSSTPGQGAGALLSCRKSFIVMMTDGYWNAAPASGGARDNNDGVAGAVISGPDSEHYRYEPRPPFADDYRDTLADVAMHYWKRDLLPEVENRVPTSAHDPAFWQHVVTYAVGFGVDGTVDADAAFAALASGARIDWRNPVGAADDSPYKTDDLLHAAINSRGGYFSAANAAELSQALLSALARIQSQNASATRIAASGSRVEGGSRVFEARYDSGSWAGQLLAYRVYDHDDLAAGTIPAGRAVGEIAASPLWDASTRIPAHGQRRILSWDPALRRGIEFAIDEDAGLSAAQLQRLLDDRIEPDEDDELVDARRRALLRFLRGARDGEEAEGQDAGGFRRRSSVLGDIVHSDPVFVGSADFGHAAATHPALRDRRAAYLARLESAEFRQRPQMVYVGANDGMLHAFDADSGRERFAFVPNAVIDQLRHLADPLYMHRYFVDGPAAAADAWIGGRWKTVLVGATGAGGRSYFALDVENPRDAAERSAIRPGLVMWELEDADLGYSIGQASIGMTESGNWVAIFGNGYNSDRHRAVLFVVDLGSGEVLARLDTGAGAEDAPNGLATPVAIDSDGNGAIDLVYAGDMQGNLWKFDFTAASPGAWQLALGGEPLFRASDGAGRPQALTSKPQVARHPSRDALLVAFGSGQFFERGDAARRDINSFYGVLDLCGRNGSACPRALSRAHLQEQRILLEATERFGEANWQVRAVSDARVGDHQFGYFLDLVSPRNGAEGERIVSAPLIWNDRVIYTTMIPSADPCRFGGSSWVMEVDPFHGSRLSFSVFDLDEDGRYDQADFVTLADASGQARAVPVSGRRTRSGITPTPAVIDGQKYISSASGGVPQRVPQFQLDGRQSWRQLR